MYVILHSYVHFCFLKKVIAYGLNTSSTTETNATTEGQQSPSNSSDALFSRIFRKQISSDAELVKNETGEVI